MSADVHELTADYERWLAATIEVVPAGIEEKHRALASSELEFLRGTYYLWLVRVSELAPDVLTQPTVPVVGDLHVQNFGTWRDHDQIRRWGVNDLDELARGSWLLDLLRLATSAAVAPHIHLGDDEVCGELLAAYVEAEPTYAADVSGPDAGHLARLVPPFGDPERFYAHLAAGPATDVPAAVAQAAARVAEAGWSPTWHEHDAGTGSLGHRRAVGVGDAADRTPHAREAKELGPGTAVWARNHLDHAPTPDPELYAAVQAAVRGPAGATRVDDWQVRDLAPDVVRIDLAGLPHHDARRLLRSMARATADVHGAETRRAREDAARLTPKELSALVTELKRSTREDYEAWR